MGNMAYPSRDNRSGGDRGGGGGHRFGGNEERQTFKAVCADCGRGCDLPFKPSGARPVYCRDCFKKHAPEGSSGDRYESRDSRGGNRGDSRRSGGDRPMFNAVCDNCGKTCQLPFEPRQGKEVFCSRCFEDKEKGLDMTQRKSNSNGTKAQSQPNLQMDAINAKLDKILNLLSLGKAEKKVEDPEQSRRASKVVEDEIEQLVKTIKAEKSIKPKKMAVKKDVRVVEPVEVIEATIETPAE